MGKAFGCSSFAELAERLGWEDKTLYGVLYDNPQMHEAIAFIISLTAECECARDAVRWADGVKKRLR